MYRKLFVCSAFNTGLFILVFLTIPLTSLANLLGFSSYNLAAVTTQADEPLFGHTNFYSGALMILGLYHLLLFLIIQKRYLAYLYYSLYAISFGVFLYCLQPPSLVP
jgi:hypothetical protein